jgi:hypothetical protein
MSKAPANDGWVTLTEGAATSVVLDTPGDVFIGTMVGPRHITPDAGDEFDVWEFHAAEQDGLADGELVNIPQSYGLRDLQLVSAGTLVRLELLKEVPTGKKLNPMKSYLIQTKG